MKVSQLLEAVLPKPAKAQKKENAPYMMLNALASMIREKEPLIGNIYTSVPSQVWTRGDGLRHKDPPFLEFRSAKEAQMAWGVLTSLPHQEVVIAGPLGSDRSDGITIDNRVFVNGSTKWQHSTRIYVYSKSGINASKVMRFIHNDADLLIDIIAAKLSGGRPLNINVSFKKNKLKGRVKSLEGRMLTIDPEDGSLKGVNIPLGIDQVWTMKDIGGVPTIVKL